MRGQLKLFSTRKPRRERDAYFTPLSAVDVLCQAQPIGGDLLDPTCGDGSMALRIAERSGRIGSVVLNDLQPQISEATLGELQRLAGRVEVTDFCAWKDFGALGSCDWLVTNPPWNLASDIAAYAAGSARVGVALLLRLSFLEATRARLWLRTDPPAAVLVLPRISFTGDGRHDSVVPAWFLWGETKVRGVRVYGPEDLRAATAR